MLVAEDFRAVLGCLIEVKWGVGACLDGAYAGRSNWLLDAVRDGEEQLILVAPAQAIISPVVIGDRDHFKREVNANVARLC